MESKIFKQEFFGRELIVEFSDLAEQTSGSALIRYGDTVVLVTAVMSSREATTDYFPLTVDYEEKFYAAGKIMGSRYMRREGRPSDEAVLTARLIDRAIRPLFNQKMRREVQVVATVLSLGEVDPDWPAFLGASIILAVSDIPWAGPIAGLRVARVDSQLVFAPTYEERARSDFDAFYAGDGKLINMVEFGGNFVAEKDVLNSVAAVQKEFDAVLSFQKKIIDELKPMKAKVVIPEPSAELKKATSEFLTGRLEEAIYTPSHSKLKSNITVVRDDLFAMLREKGFEGDDLGNAGDLFEEAIGELVCEKILKEEKRPDGRGLKEVRTIGCQLDILPRVHGSAVFKRGATHALSGVTLASPGAEQMIETIELSGTKGFIHHYNFPPYSVGETGSFRRGPGRRELGHGNLAEKALLPLIPDKDKFPYTVRVVSEILSSNGSSSMASVCGSSLALMAAGVPMKSAAAGIAMGLVLGDDGTYKVLTDIQGPEDHHGDMDLKVAGTKDGVTAMQMDVKVLGVSLEILKDALVDARTARLHILGKMEEAIAAPRTELSPHAPQIAGLKIDPQKIGTLIGPGGKMIHKIVADTGVLSIDVEDDGGVFISATSREALDKAVAAVSGLTHEYKAGEIVEGVVAKLLEFGAIVEFGFQGSGLLHISELAHRRVEKVEDVIKLGDKVKAKIIAADPTNGKISLSLKALSPRP